MRSFLALSFALILTSGCENDDVARLLVDAGTPRDAAGRTDGGVAPGGLCEVDVTYRATASTPRVHVAGDWNTFSMTADELVDDGTGLYRITLRLRPGLYAYKLYVEGDGADPWRLDPGNAYRAYAGGVENSGLLVPDCSVPRLVVEVATPSRAAAGDGRLEATLRYDAQNAGPPATIRAELSSAGATRALTDAELVRTGDQLTIRVAGLTDGKHTIRVQATGAAGGGTGDVLLPFWIEADAFEWRDALIYMVMADRFRNGDMANDSSPAGASNGAGFAGGDLQGLTQAIEEGYLDGLGVRALWVSPFNVNPDGVFADADESHQVSGYHGYWPTDPLAVDRRIGGESALDQMVAAAHRHGIRVLMDLVVNHVHEQHPYVRTHPEWFNAGCICGTGGCDWTARRLDCLFRPYMPDVDWTNGYASEQFIADSLAWMERHDLDGFRVDAVKHVVDGAIFNLGIRVRQRFETAGTKVFLMGETAMGWDGSSGPTAGSNPENYGTISRYIGPAGLTGQFDFVLYYAAAMQFPSDAPGRGMLHVDYWTRASQEHYPAGAVMTPYIGSHDTPRFMTITSDPARAGNKWDDLPTAPSSDEPYDRMYVALAWLFAIPGAPLLYYGDEYGEFGGSDPDNRHSMRFGSALSPREARQLDRVQRLGEARRSLVALRRGEYQPVHVTDDVWIVARGSGADLVIVAMNRGGSTQTIDVPIPSTLAAEGRAFDDALGSGTRPTVTRATLSLMLRPRTALYLH